MNLQEGLTRRDFLTVAGLAGLGFITGACTRPETRNAKITPDLGWLSFVTPNNLYAINYPATWESPDINNKSRQVSNIVSFYSLEKTPTGYPINEVYIGWWNISGGPERPLRKYKNLEEYVKTTKQNTISFYSRDKRQVSPIAESRMKLDGQEAAVLQFTTKEETKLYDKPYNKVSGHITILFIRGGNNWEIDWISHGDETSIERTRPIFDKMLSSFKFLQ